MCIYVYIYMYVYICIYVYITYNSSPSDYLLDAKNRNLIDTVLLLSPHGDIIHSYPQQLDSADLVIEVSFDFYKLTLTVRYNKFNCMVLCYH